MLRPTVPSRRSGPSDEQLQSEVDLEAWRLLARRDPRVAQLVFAGLFRGEPVEQVVHRVRETHPALEVVLPCAAHGCARLLEREAALGASSARPRWPGWVRGLLRLGGDLAAAPKRR